MDAQTATASELIYTVSSRDLLNHSPLTYTLKSVPSTNSFAIDSSERLKKLKKKNLEIICFKLVLFIIFIETLKNNPTHMTQLIIWYVLILLIIQTFSKSYWCSLIFTFDFLWRHVKAVDRWGPCVPYLMRPTPRYTCTSPSQTDSSRSKPYSASIFSVRVNLWAIKVFLIDKTKYLKADFSCTCMSV